MLRFLKNFGLEQTLQRKLSFALTLQMIIALVALGACSNASLERYDAQATVDNGPLVNSYRSLVLPSMQKNCMSCHATGKAMASIAHSDPDAKVAWQAALDNGLWNFDAPEQSKLIKKLKGGHNCWGPCADNAAYMATQLGKFKVAMGDDLANLGASGDDNEEITYTAAQPIPANLDTPRANSNPATYDSKDMVYDISAESKVTGAKLVLTIGRANFNAVYANYYVNNIRLVSATPIYARKIVIMLNGSVDSSNSTYDLVEANLSSTPTYTANKDGNVVAGGTQIDNGLMSVAKAKGPGVDVIQVGFGSIGKGIVDPLPTFADIKAILLNAKYGQVGAATDPIGCASCHAANFMSPANLADETTFRASLGPGGKPIIVAGSPDTSPLYVQVNTFKMPKASVGTKLTPEERDKIRRFIKGQ